MLVMVGRKMSKEFLDINIFTHLPQSLSNDKGIVNLFKAVDKELKEIVNKKKYLYLIANIDILPEKIIELLAWQWHVDFWDGDLSLDRKRALVKNSIRWHCIKGTPAAVEEVVRAAYGNCDLQEWFNYDGKPYHFRVNVKLEEESTDKNRWKKVLYAIESSKNVRSHLEKISFYYPDIKQKIKVDHVSNVMQIVEPKHRIWNLGGAKKTYWDAEYNLDAKIRLDGIVPGQGYKERQAHQAKINISVNSRHKNDYRLVNVFNGGFCMDGSHMLNGARVMENRINHSCLIESNGGIEAQ